MEIFNAADFLVDRHVRDGNGARLAVGSGSRSLSYAGPAGQVHRVAACGAPGWPGGGRHRQASIGGVARGYGPGVLGFTPSDGCLSVPKLFFAYGLGNSCCFPLAAGATAILERARPTPALIASRIAA